MTISVVLVTYNRCALLPLTIESILAQTLADFELIISDDCSTDDTAALCDAYVRRDPRVRYRCNERRLGMPGNLNAALREGTGELVANLHDGDLYDRELLERWSAALQACPQAAFVFNSYCHLAPDGSVGHISSEVLPTCFAGHLLLEQLYFRRWRFGSPVWGSVMARRAAYDETGLFQDRFGFYSDVDMWLRLAEIYEVAYVDLPLIRLPSRAVVPRLFSLPVAEERRLIRRVFWEARLRHYRERPFRCVVELGRHGVFAAINEGLEVVLLLRRRALKRRAPRLGELPDG